MKNLMLDTSAYAYFKRGHAGVVHTLREVNAILMPAIVIGELFAVLKSGNQ